MSTRRRALAAAGVLLAALLTGCSSSQAHEVRAPAGYPVGLSLGNSLFDLDQADVDHQLDDVVAAGANWIRIDMSWASVQPDDATSYTWAPLDRIVSAATSRGLHVLGIITYTPPWARGPGCVTFTCGPADPTAFATFAGQVAARYAGTGVGAYEIWNEPNLSLFYTDPDPVAYRNVLIPTAAAVHAAAPAATVLFGGLAGNFTGADAIGADQFVQTACETGACATLDGFAYHPYTFPYSPEQASEPPNAWTRMTQSGSGGPSLTSVLVGLGLGAKPLWLTEVGAPTSGALGAVDGSVASLAAANDHVTDDWQAHIVSQSVLMAAADPSVFGGVFVYTLDDTDDTAQQGSFGLRRVDGSAKPSYDAFRDAAEEVDGG
jgi:hypothetical protein